MEAGSKPDTKNPLHVLLDTNVLLDLVLAREPWATEAKPVFDAADAGLVFLYVPASVLTDIFYICRKLVGIERAKLIIEECLQRSIIISVDRVILEAALQLPGNDFEDNVQIACGQLAQLNYIVTRDVSGFRQAPLEAIAPPDLAHLLRTP